MTNPAIPPGWPTDLPPPGTPEFHAQAVGWLLDRLPPEYRVASVRHYPVALAMLCVRHSSANLEACREAYRNARVELRGQPGSEVDTTLTSLETLGSQFQRTVREVALVEQAMRGIQWTAKL